MKAHRYVSPTGVPIIGTLETVTARAELSEINEDGSPVYLGDTEVFWDDQKTVERDGNLVFLDRDGGEWIFAELTREEVDA